MRAAAAALFVLCAAAGCVPPAGRYDAAAGSAGLSERIVKGQRFHHKIFSNAHAVQNGALHVFIEGDTSVKQALRTSPPDPTPRRALMLRMMQNDAAAAIMLGRPCYHGLFAADKCAVRHLGPERYSEEVMASMHSVLQDEIRRSGARRAVLIGYSGGGTLAMLLAARTPATAALVTLAGNLDNMALTAHHHAPALSGSLDPADLPPLARSMLQLHFFGARDKVAPAALAQKTLARQNAEPVILQDFDHECCWETVWPVIHPRIHADLQQSPSASGSYGR